MEIKMIKVEDIKPYANNPRFNDDAVEYVAKSIKEFGFKVPMVIDKNNEIVAGHTRYKASLELGLKEVPCIIADDLTDEQIKAFRLADNKVSEKSEWNDDLLNIELQDLDIDMSDFGFDLDLDIEEEQEIIEDEVPEVPEEPKAKLGDIYQLGRHFLMCGDSTKEEDVSKLMNGVKADMVFTDPPYGMNLDTDFSSMKSKLGTQFGERGLKGGKYEQGIVDDFNPKMIDLIMSLNVKETFLWGADYFAELLPNKNDGSWIVWDKRSNENNPIEYANQSDKMYGSCFELCWSKNKHKRDIARIKWAGLFGVEKEFDKKRVHPTQKPIELCKWFMEKYSKENSIILDLFGGSGSTLIACEQLNRKCYMMELDTHYISVIIERYINFTGNDVYRLNPDGTKTNWRDIECEKEK